MKAAKINDSQFLQGVYFWVQIPYDIDFPLALFYFISLLNISWWVYLGRSISKYRDPGGQHGISDLSVIIVFRNELENIQELLPLLGKQKVGFPLEYVFVDDGSEDSGGSLINDYGFPSGITKKLIKIDQVPHGISPKKFAIQRAIENCSSQNLIFIDADCIPASEDWAEIMGGGLGEAKIVMGLGNYEFKVGFLNQLIQFDTFITAFQFIGWALRGRPYMSLGRNWGYKKKLFLEKSGFEGLGKILGGDDDLLFQKIGQKEDINVFLSPKSRTISKPKDNYWAWLNQKVRHLRSGLHYSILAKFYSALVLNNHLFLGIGLGLLMISFSYLYLIWPLLLIRYLVCGQMIRMSQKKMGSRMSLFLFPVLELLYWGSHLIAFFASLFVSNPKWKKREIFQVKQ